MALAFAVACTAVIFLSYGTGSTAEQSGFDVNALRGAGSGKAADWVEDVYLSFAMVVSACGPDQQKLAPLAGTQPYEAIVACSGSGMSSFGDWATSECLGTSSSWSADRQTTYQSCTAELDKSLQNRSVPLGDSSRLYCACPAALLDFLQEHSTAVYGVSTSTAVLLVLLFTCVMCTRKLASKAKKKKLKRQEADEGYYEETQPFGQNFGETRSETRSMMGGSPRTEPSGNGSRSGERSGHGSGRAGDEEESHMQMA